MVSAAPIAAMTAVNAGNAARAAHRAYCEKLVNSYDASTATVDQAREYAKCVYTLYGDGQPLDPVAVLLLKATILLAFAGGAIGAWHGHRKEGLFGAACFGVLGLASGPVLVGVLALLFAALAFLVS
jgi:hypothetical protein